ncbi:MULTISPECIES: PP2C family protein-serine/threonine phosphatase [unclassified Clostridium]|uniref:PP2C family protein-serine/threonine phosphatase n=1 Tax=unclassified Clostridium TaxID=2614128 RepID=UPI0032175419
MRFLVGYCTDNGIKKDINEDSLLIKTATSPFGRIGLFIVCDGMGGFEKGELASATIIRDMNRWFNEELPHINFNKVYAEDIYNLINEKILKLNEKILAYGLRMNERLGTTLTMFLTINNKYYIFQIGDSRVYKIEDSIEQLTMDQTLVQREIERGNITKEEGRRHPNRNILLQCVGAKKEINVDMVIGEIKENQIYVICSDGFYGKLREREIYDALKVENINTKDDLNNRAKELVEIAKSRKEADNITTIIIKALE